MKNFANLVSKVTIGVFCLFILLQSVHSFTRVATTFTPDASIFYKSANDLIHEVSPYSDKTLYTAFNYPPITALFFIPLLVLPYQLVQIFLLILNCILLGVSLLLSFKILQKKWSWTLGTLFFCLGLIFFPFRFTVGMGQVNMVGFALLLGSFLLWQRQKTGVSSLLFVLAVCIKPVLLFLVLFFIMQKSWKWLMCTGSLLVGVVGISFLLFSKFYLIYLTSVVPHLLTTSGREVYFNQGLTGFVARLTTITLVRSVISLVAELAFTGVALWFGRKKKPEVFFGILLTTLLLVDSLSWQHHFVFLLLPFIVAWQYRIKKLWYTVLLGVSFILVAANIAHPQILQNFPSSLVLSHVFYGTILLGILLQLLPSTKKKKIN